MSSLRTAGTTPSGWLSPHPHPKASRAGLLFQYKAIDHRTNEARDFAPQHVERHGDELLFEAQDHHAVNGREQVARKQAELSRRPLRQERDQRALNMPEQPHLLDGPLFRDDLARLQAMLEHRAPEF